MWVIAYDKDYNGGGWCVVSFKTGTPLAGPFATHEEAVAAIQTAVHRIAQGWKP